MYVYWAGIKGWSGRNDNASSWLKMLSFGTQLCTRKELEALKHLKRKVRGESEFKVIPLAFWPYDDAEAKTEA